MEVRKLVLAPEGKKILIFLTLVSFFLGIVGFYFEYKIIIMLYFISGVLLIFSCNFRDPIRKCSSDESSILSPADGKIIRIDQVDDDEVGNNSSRISIFLNVFNVHVNRIPFNITSKESHV